MAASTLSSHKKLKNGECWRFSAGSCFIRDWAKQDNRRMVPNLENFARFWPWPYSTRLCGRLILCNAWTRIFCCTLSHYIFYPLYCYCRSSHFMNSFGSCISWCFPFFEKKEKKKSECQSSEAIRSIIFQELQTSCRANLCHLNLLYGNYLTETLLTASGNSELVVKSKKVDFTKPIEQIRCVFCRSGIFHKSTRYQVSTYEDSFREDCLIWKIQYCCCSCCRCSRNFQF